jgi:L-2-hydroxyglutarate oxidase LhgO
MAADIETVVIGAGAVGLAIARALRLTGQEVMVLEQHPRAGSETSSRNSEVIHAGLYYAPGSLRARLCVRGKELLYRFCSDYGVTVRRCGKLVVATSEPEIAALDRIAGTAAANGVADFRKLSRQEVRSLEPELACLAAYLSPSTGVIDSHGLITALEGHFMSLGGQIVLNARVSAVRNKEGYFELETESGGSNSCLTAKNLVIAAGLGATRLGKMLAYRDGYRVPETYPAKGHYFALTGRAPFRHLIYPVPQGAWLGVHLTLDVSGRAKFGPDLEWQDKVSYDFEDEDGARLATFVREIRRYWPGLPEGALRPDYTGVRPKIYRQGEPVADFAIHGPETHGLPGLVALYGIESPGLTAALAIGEHAAALL